MNKSPRHRLRIPYEQLDAINDLLLNPQTRAVNDFFAVVERYGQATELLSPRFVRLSIQFDF